MLMLLLQKPCKTKEDLIQLRTVIDLREQNKNTKKLLSPLSDIKSVLRRVASKKYKSLINSKDTYKQIRIIPEHINKLIFNTPDKTIVSKVIQLSNCNSRVIY